MWFNRKNVVSKPLKDFNTCDDFFTLVITGYILTAAMEMRNDVPSTHHKESTPGCSRLKIVGKP